MQQINLSTHGWQACPTYKLIARSFKLLKDKGMTEAALTVDAENISGALGLYESMGFRTVKRHTTYHKPLE